MEYSDNDKVDYTKDSVKYQVDFLKQEYIQMFSTWFQLKKEKTEYIKIYITLVTIPATIMFALLEFKGNESMESLNILKKLDPFAPILTIISMLGFVITAILIDLRLESILYIRNINSIRDAFSKFNRGINLEEILRLPIKDDIPSFIETPFISKNVYLTSVTILNITFMALVNFLYFYSSALNGLIKLLKIQLTGNSFIIVNFIISSLFFVFHFYYYEQVCKKKDKDWKRARERFTCVVARTE